MKKLLAEFLGTFVLVLFGCGAAILAGGYIGVAGIALAFGLAVMVMAYAVGPISGGHFNPAVSIGLAIAGRFEWKNVAKYCAAQVLGAVVAALILFFIVKTGGLMVGGFAANTTMGTFTIWSALLCEIVMTAVFLLVILGTTAKEAAAGFAGAAIGLALTTIHLVSIPVTNTSVNPARSISQAIFSAEPLALGQLWIFIVAPIAGAALGAVIWKQLAKKA